MKLSFIYKLEDEYWNDGLKKAVDVISEKHEVRKHNGTYKNFFADFVLVWGALGSWQQKVASELPFRKGICIAGGPINHPAIHDFDVVFVETVWHKMQFKKIGIKTHVAFGTNTELFYDMGLERTIDNLYPAAFAKWKRHDLWLKKPGNKLAVGYMQPNGHEKECYEMCLKDKNTTVMPRIKPEVLPWLYNQAKKVSVTSDIYGGGERTVLEALSCGCQVEVERDNEKLVDLLDRSKSKVPDHIEYATALMRGIEEVL